jgi:hypothetical protein
MSLMSAKKNAKWVNLFFNIIKKAYLGEEFVYGKETFRLQPTLVRPSDFHRRTFGPSLTSYEALLKVLDPKFKTVASSEVYRVKTGWIAQGIRGYDGHKIRRVKVDEDIFLIPDLSKRPSVAIDTSSSENNETVMVICLIPDYEGAYFFLEKHLKLPKDRHEREFHWRVLNPIHKQDLVMKFNLILPICCNGLLTIKTIAFKDRRGKMENLFKNLIEGCFSGYESHPIQKNLRPALKQKFFEAMNGVEIHCDADFRPLTPEKIVRLLVQTLAKKNGEFETYTPLFANLRSHESKPIQIADIIAGIIRTKIEQGDSPSPLQPLPFDLRKMKKYADNPPKAYFWFCK